MPELRIREDGFDEDKVRESIRKIASETELATLATTDGERGHAATVFYSFTDDFKIFFLTEPDTEHCQHIEEREKVSMSIYDSHQNWTDEKQGLQVFGECKKLESPKEAFENYTDRFPALMEYVEDHKIENIDSEFYVVDPERIKVFDEPRFGKETWINAELD